jgi:hypothetical protein
MHYLSEFLGPLKNPMALFGVIVVTAEQLRLLQVVELSLQIQNQFGKGRFEVAPPQVTFGLAMRLHPRQLLFGQVLIRPRLDFVAGVLGRRDL